MRCSARSFGSASRRRSSSRSASRVTPRGSVPAMGRVSTTSPVTRTSISGDAPTSVHSAVRSRNMYGDGLMERSAR